MRILRKTILAAAMTFIGLAATAQTAREDLLEKRERSGNNHFAYDASLVQKNLTPAPKGYKPFYISTYMRHGSRYHLREALYTYPCDVLLDAEKAGKLSASGRKILTKMLDIRDEARGQYGELTSVGAAQHKGIAERMGKNFPEVFKGKAEIDVHSSVVVRCILSMNAELMQLKTMYPKMHVSCKAAARDMAYLNPDGAPYAAYADSCGMHVILDSLKKAMIPCSRFMEQFISDKNYVASRVDTTAFVSSMFILAYNLQNHDRDEELYSLFTDEEIYQLWKYDNIRFNMEFGPSPRTGGKTIYKSTPLLRKIIADADSVLATKSHGADLRFGHEVVLMPLACLLEIDNLGEGYDDFDEMTENWRGYEIFPMAANIQLIFYRNGRGNVLVKAMLNEREVTLPGDQSQAPYYSWRELRDYYLDKLDSFVLW